MYKVALAILVQKSQNKERRENAGEAYAREKLAEPLEEVGKLGSRVEVGDVQVLAERLHDGAGELDVVGSDGELPVRLHTQHERHAPRGRRADRHVLVDRAAAPGAVQWRRRRRGRRRGREQLAAGLVGCRWRRTRDGEADEQRLPGRHREALGHYGVQREPNGHALDPLLQLQRHVTGGLAASGRRVQRKHTEARQLPHHLKHVELDAIEHFESKIVLQKFFRLKTFLLLYCTVMYNMPAGERVQYS